MAQPGQRVVADPAGCVAECLQRLLGFVLRAHGGDNPQFIGLDQLGRLAVVRMTLHPDKLLQQPDQDTAHGLDPLVQPVQIVRGGRRLAVSTSGSRRQGTSLRVGGPVRSAPLAATVGFAARFFVGLPPSRPSWSGRLWPMWMPSSPMLNSRNSSE